MSHEIDRTDLYFSSGGVSCAAWLYPAAAESDTVPIIVMAHGLSGTRRDRLGAFAERFAAAGIAALVFDYRGFGDSEGEPDYFVPEYQLSDWHAAIAFARSLAGIDADRVATFGSSLGGGNALAAAAEDPSVTAAISQVPFLDRDTQTYSGHPEVVEEMLAVARDGGYLPAVGQPHEAAFIRAPGAEAGSWARHTAPSATPQRCTARGWSALPGMTKWPNPSQRSTPRDKPPTASCVSTQVSTTSTSTTAQSTRRSSPTSSNSSVDTSCSPRAATARHRRRVNSSSGPRPLSRHGVWS
jgi:dienelactone hydrolase